MVGASGNVFSKYLRHNFVNTILCHAPLALVIVWSLHGTFSPDAVCKSMSNFAHNTEEVTGCVADLLAGSSRLLCCLLGSVLPRCLDTRRREHKPEFHIGACMYACT